MKKSLIIPLVIYFFVFTCILNAQPTDPVLKTACRLIRDGKTDKAIELLRKDLEFRPWNNDIRLYLGIGLFLKNEKDTAFQEFQKIEKETKKMTGDARSFGDERMFLDMGMDRANKGVFSEQYKGLFNFSYGLVLKQNGNYKEAEKKFKEAIKSGYEELQVRFQLLDLYLKQNNLKKAEKEYNSISKIIPEDEGTLFLKGYLLARNKKYSQAASFFEKLLSMKPDYISAKVNLGIISYNNENYQDAINYWSEVLSIKPDAKDVLINLGRAYFHSGENQKAQEYFDKAGIRISPDKYSPKKISLLKPTLDEKIEFNLNCEK